MSSSTTFPLLLLICLSTSTADFVYKERKPANINGQWIAALAAGVCMAALMVIILLIMAHLVVRLRKRNERLRAHTFVDEQLFLEAFSPQVGSPVPLLDNAARPDQTSRGRRSSERFVYYNKGLEGMEEEAEEGGGEGSARNREVGFNPNIEIVDIDHVTTGETSGV
jgi:hypothetical protein